MLAAVIREGEQICRERKKTVYVTQLVDGKMNFRHNRSGRQPWLLPRSMARIQPEKLSSSNMTVLENDSRPRKIPFLSSLAFFPVQLIFGMAHIVLSKIAPRAEPTFSTFVGSALFGLPLVSFFFYTGLGKLLEYVGVFPVNVIWTWILTPFFGLYIVWILLLDQTHTEVKNSGRRQLSGPIERASEAFFWATTNYIPHYITCVPWSKDARLPTETGETYVFACHPHGIHCFSLIELTNPHSDFSRMFPNVTGIKLTGLAATVIFKLPVVRELFLYMGYIDASRSVASRALFVGQSIAVCVGGEEESMLTTPKKDIYVLQNRKGFVRLALSHGASLVPVLAIRANELYTTYKFLFNARMWLQKKFGIALPIFHGRWGTPLPHPIPVKVVIGKPIPTPKPNAAGAKPDDNLVEEYHAKYIECVRKLHTQHAPKDTELIIQ
jgi:1-acyl-sn-glycerol-3-phosphate acyltransferase